MKVGMRDDRLVGFDEDTGRWAEIGAPFTDDLIDFLAAGEDGRAQARELMARETRYVEPPNRLPFRPTSLRDFSLWEAHMVASARSLVHTFGSSAQRRAVDTYERVTRRTFPALRPKSGFHDMPQFYVGNHRSVVVDGDAIVWPPYSDVLDFELEIGVVMAHSVRDCSPSEGRDAIGGFVVFNDCTARDTQWRDLEGSTLGGMVKAKTFANAIGAVVVTADELIDDWTATTGRVRVNGEQWCEGTAADPAHDLGDMVAFAAAGETLEAGALLGTGTLPGCSGLEVGRFPVRGDVVECELDGIGSVTTTYGV